MTEILAALLLFAALVGCAWGCMHLQCLLAEHHRSRETAESVRLMISSLVTFSALVLGLLTTSVKANFDAVADDVRGYAAQIIIVNRLLQEYGPDTVPARRLLREYTADAIATTWTAEPPPPNSATPPPDPTDGPMENSTLLRMLTDIDSELLALEPPDPLHQRLATAARSQFAALLDRRWKLIERLSGRASDPFYPVIVFWLIAIFAVFGLTAPRNMLVFVTIAICAAFLASVFFIIQDLSTPFTGIFMIPSAPMRDALAHLSDIS